MKNQEEFTLNVRSIIEDDPKEILLDSVEHILHQAVWRDVPEDIKDRLVAPHLQALYADARPCLQRRDFATLDRHITKFRINSTETIAYERREGSLRPWSASDAIKPWARRLVELHFNGYEISLLTQMLQKVGGETIRDAALREITTDRRVIARADLRAFAQGPRPWDNQNDFERAFTSETILANAELAAAHEKREREHPVYRSGPPRLIGTPIEN